MRLVILHFSTPAIFTTALALIFIPGYVLAGGNTYSLGVEGFYDNYREPDPGVSENAGYGSVTGHYTHDFDHAFLAVDARASYGRDDYTSPSGTENDIPQWEYESRLRAGITLPLGGGNIMPYVGAGVRYFRDENKDGVTDLGAYGYERRILQFYIPIGTTYSVTTADGWTFAPNAEFEPLVYGQVNSRLTDGGGPNIYNNQRSGYGLRGEFMVGRAYDHLSWQIGPFVRFWDISSSDPTSDPQHPGNYYYEPHNTRLQTGVALRVLW